ncbi:MAG: hypothetical protein WA947_23215 [Phormidesmis sp.]
MQYQVLVQNPSERHFVASVVGLSNVVADGKTEEEAIAKIKAALTSQLSVSKLVTIEIESEDIDREKEQGKTADPWIRHAGIFADDPTFDDFLEEIATFRRRADEKTNI